MQSKELSTRESKDKKIPVGVFKWIRKEEILREQSRKEKGPKVSLEKLNVERKVQIGHVHQLLGDKLRGFAIRPEEVQETEIIDRKGVLIGVQIAEIDIEIDAKEIIGIGDHTQEGALHHVVEVLREENQCVNHEVKRKSHHLIVGQDPQPVLLQVENQVALALRNQ